MLFCIANHIKGGTRDSVISEYHSVILLHAIPLHPQLLGMEDTTQQQSVLDTQSLSLASPDTIPVLAGGRALERLCKLPHLCLRQRNVASGSVFAHLRL